MKVLKFIFFVVLFSFLTNKTHAQKINGLSFVAAPDSLRYKYVKPVLNVKSNFVALMPFGFIKDLKSPKIVHNTNRQWFGETEKGILQYAKKFKENNIKVMVKPHIWVWHGEYTGHIEMKSETQWRVLEDSYTSFILTYAKAAKKMNAEIFCIGTELEKFVAKRPKFWLQLIQKIRTVYQGKLTYASNWDEFKRVTFWGELDFIGVDAYFPLSDKKTPSVEDLETGWKPYKNEIKRIQKHFKKQVIFTEYGYRSVDFTGKEPWDSKHVKDSVNIDGQINGLKAIHQQFWGEDWFAGGFIWKWFLRYDEVGGSNNNRFTPQNKSTEKVLKNLYE